MRINANNESDEIKELEVPTSMMLISGLWSRPIMKKLIVMTWLWVAAFVTYNMIDIYLKYLPGSLYLNLAVSGLSEILAYVVTVALFLKLKPKWTFFLGFVTAFVGGSCLFAWEDKLAQYPALVAVFVLLAKFGCSMAVCACYVSTPFVFPTKLCGTAFGICNCFARFVSIASPMIAEKEIPIPMSVFSVFTLISIIVCLLVDVSKT